MTALGWRVVRDPYSADGTTKEFAGPVPPVGRGFRPPTDPWVVIALVVGGTALIVAVAGLIVAARSNQGGGPGPVAAPPATQRTAEGAGPSPSPSPSPARRRGSATSPAAPAPTMTRLAWRSEELSDGSTRMVVGDVDAAPRDPDWIGGSDYRTAGSATKVVQVHGWWCATKVSAAVSASGGRLRGGGFVTRCSGRPGRMRQRYAFERSSWSGFRPYTGDRWTAWTGAQVQTAAAPSAPCPAGRTGTYDYRLSVVLEIAGRPVGDAYAVSDDRYRGDCGTGVT
jgi:hypothetical protein